eukprot:TRINITY_DN27261_c0_g1_i1.p1 TRINITY_DN27261_c0_g1~~TRINITY_DN27261_c0_g1_i1.p1  ORF type:complete len:471 (-),score=137.13 TRINITY_DN27261_c0_g1_i1:261-1673(-)
MAAWLNQAKDEYENLEDENEDEEVACPPGFGTAASDEKFGALQAAVLQALAGNGSAMSTGKIGFTLSARKKPVAAALYSLLEQGAVRRIDGIPPRWEALAQPEGVPAELLAQAAETFSYKESTKTGPRPRHGDFETMKRVVCQFLAKKGAEGATAGALGYELGACRKAVNAALYACEKEGVCWTVGEKAAGERLRWCCAAEFGSLPAAELPAAFTYAAPAAAAPHRIDSGLAETDQPRKKARIAPPATKARPAQSVAGSAGNGSNFETLKLILRHVLTLKGEAGATSGALGYEVQARKKAVSAALFSCEREGTVLRSTPDGVKPRWVSQYPPPDDAQYLQLPPEFAYAGHEDDEEQETHLPHRAPPIPRGAPPIPRGAPPIPRGAPPIQRGVPGAGAAVPGAAGNAIAVLNEWGQKNRHSIVFQDLGSQPGGGFLCQVTVDGQAYPPAAASNKKEAKRLAAVAVVANLGL